jgi:hypothetical protein
MTPACGRLSNTFLMTYTSRKRDRYRRAATGVTAATTVGALTMTGWLTGVAASDYAGQQAQRAREQAAASAQAQREQNRYNTALARQARAHGPLIVYKDRPVKKRVTVHYVTGYSVGSSTVGSGGTVSSSASQSAPTATSGSSGGSQAPAPAPAPPPPPPQPAPSTGS